jgi:short-subunit dehydrogenase
VAGTHSGLLVTRMPMMSSEEVVEISLRALETGKLRVVTGLANRLLGFLVRFTPGSLQRAVGARLYKP